MIKRTIDIIFSITALLILSPILIIVSLMVWIFHGWPVFFSQERPGKEGVIFKLYKFRTMTNTRDSEGELLPDEERLTQFGKTLRSTSIDELPELMNILKGEMSFVGPRPLLVEYLPLYNERQMKRHNVRPGLTGWAQVNGRNNLEWKTKFENDIWYIENQSLSLDIKIIIRTIVIVFRRQGITDGSGVSMERFMGNE